MNNNNYYYHNHNFNYIPEKEKMLSFETTMSFISVLFNDFLIC
jgi:hypothetical protein